MVGTNNATSDGKNEVSSAAKIQCVKLPRDWPSARWRFGKISEMNTQITAPCPTACAAIKAKMQAGTILKCPVKNAHAQSPSDAI